MLDNICNTCNHNKYNIKIIHTFCKNKSKNDFISTGEVKTTKPSLPLNMYNIYKN